MNKNTIKFNLPRTIPQLSVIWHLYLHPPPPPPHSIFLYAGLIIIQCLCDCRCLFQYSFCVVSDKPLFKIDLYLIHLTMTTSLKMKLSMVRRKQNITYS